jgi:hypothetical protein
MIVSERGATGLTFWDCLEAGFRNRTAQNGLLSRRNQLHSLSRAFPPFSSCMNRFFLRISSRRSTSRLISALLPSSWGPVYFLYIPPIFGFHTQGRKSVAHAANELRNGPLAFSPNRNLHSEPRICSQSTFDRLIHLRSCILRPHQLHEHRADFAWVKDMLHETTLDRTMSDRDAALSRTVSYPTSCYSKSSSSTSSDRLLSSLITRCLIPADREICYYYYASFRACSSWSERLLWVIPIQHCSGCIDLSALHSEVLGLTLRQFKKCKTIRKGRSLVENSCAETSNRAHDTTRITRLGAH